MTAVEAVVVASMVAASMVVVMVVVAAVVLNEPRVIKDVVAAKWQRTNKEINKRACGGIGCPHGEK